ncbi:hypothetical protein L9Z73_03200 [Pseudomonas sp. TNT11]|uniref:Electron transport complex protein RnfE n=1 Tax=Pseudomonas emilianonis TaxID=2915812 RepID=A0ABT0ED25_9PSED|nr:Rnf-Nqr domain containing protein [Pseudomonas emilianonis]MCK1783399.1 hypothetical protein [Pseudomonas emilianonis]
MTKAVGLANASMLAPLLGVTDTLPKALSFLALSTLIVTFYGLTMRALRSRLSTPLRLGASLTVAATLVSCAQLLLQAFALPMYQQLGIYLALISVQCVVLEHQGFFEASQRKAQLRLVGLFAALMIILGLLRATVATQLMPAGFILLGLLLAGLQAWAHFSQSR